MKNELKDFIESNGLCITDVIESCVELKKENDINTRTEKQLAAGLMVHEAILNYVSGFNDPTKAREMAVNAYLDTLEGEKKPVAQTVITWYKMFLDANKEIKTEEVQGEE